MFSPSLNKLWWQCIPLPLSPKNGFGMKVTHIKNNFEEFDKVDIAYNRVSAKGDVLGVDLSDFRGKPSCRVMIALDGEIISDTIEVDFEEYKEDIIELHHYPKDESKESVYIEVI